MQEGSICADERLELYQTSSWLSSFRPVCFKTVCLDLPDGVLSFLDADGISSQDVPQAVPPTASDTDSEATDEEQSGASDHSDPALGQFKERVNDTIQSLGGKVMAKLNWSAPVDAQWISPTGLSCQNADEVFLLLKSSDRAAHDLACVRQLQAAVQHSCTPAPSNLAEPTTADQGACLAAVRPQLVLKRYHELEFGMEFRCFVQHGNLVGISQRDPTQQFPALQDELPTVKTALLDFFASKISSKFPLDDYVFDVCIIPKMRIRLLDFNPPGGTTQPLMFTWEELHTVAELMHSSPAGSEHECELRVVTDRMHVQAGAQSVFGVPADTLELQGMTWGDVMQHLASEVSKQNLQDG